MLNQGYDFSVITVNDQKVRVFDTKQLSVYEALTIAGYKSHEIMGRSGRNLSFTLNGVRKTVKGSAMTPAEVFVNDRPASIMTKVTQGDRIRITPAMSGQNATAKLSDVVGYSRFNSGKVTFGGEEYEIGLHALVNGEPKEPDYLIQPLDSIESSGIVTFGDLMRIMDAGLDGMEYRVNDEIIGEDYTLCDGDVITAYDSYGNIIGAAPEAPEQPEPEQTPEAPAADETPEEPEAETAPEEPEAPTATGKAIPFNGPGLTVEINGELITLPPRNGDYILLDLLNSIDIDPAVPNSEIILEINGRPANFSSYLSSGDKAVIKVQTRREEEERRTAR